MTAVAYRGMLMTAISIVAFYSCIWSGSEKTTSLRNEPTCMASIIKLVTWADQCLINKFAENKKIILDPKWNRQIFSHALDQAAWQRAAAPGNSKVTHFLGRIKPWQKWGVLPISDFWWVYANELALPHFHRMHLTWFDRGFRLAKRCTPRLIKGIARRLIK